MVFVLIGLMLVEVMGVGFEKKHVLHSLREVKLQYWQLYINIGKVDCKNCVNGLVVRIANS